MKCQNCGRPAIAGMQFCGYCGAKYTEKSLPPVKPIPWKVEGWWKVTTEGDCEGKSVNQLGTYQGNIVDIAQALADKAYYHLTFEPVAEPVLPPPVKPAKQSRVQLGIGSGTWDLRDKDQLVRTIQAWLGDEAKGVVVAPCNYYASVTFEYPETPESSEVEAKD